MVLISLIVALSPPGKPREVCTLINMQAAMMHRLAEAVCAVCLVPARVHWSTIAWSSPVGEPAMPVALDCGRLEIANASAAAPLHFCSEFAGETEHAEKKYGFAQNRGAEIDPVAAAA
jgi:hypothetical protein